MVVYHVLPLTPICLTRSKFLVLYYAIRAALQLRINTQYISDIQFIVRIHRNWFEAASELAQHSWHTDQNLATLKCRLLLPLEQRVSKLSVQHKILSHRFSVIRGRRGLASGLGLEGMRIMQADPCLLSDVWIYCRNLA